MTFHDDDSSGDGVHEDETDTEVKCVKSKDDYFDNASTQAISSFFSTFYTHTTKRTTTFLSDEYG